MTPPREQTLIKLHTIAKRPITQRELQLREILETKGVIFLPPRRMAFLPPIITDLYSQESIYAANGAFLENRTLPKVNTEQVRWIVPTEPTNTYELRVLAVTESIQDLASFLSGEVMTDSFEDHDARSKMKNDLQVEHPDYDQLYQLNQLRGNKLTLVVAGLSQLARFVGNNELAQLNGLSKPDDITGKFHVWHSQIDEIVKGRKEDNQRRTEPELWSLPGKYSNGEKISIIKDINNIILETLQILSVGMQQSTSIIRFT